jgi:hypothetical protein
MRDARDAAVAENRATAHLTSDSNRIPDIPVQAEKYRSMLIVTVRGAQA